MKTFYAILANSLAAFLTNTFVWFAVTFWVYLETQSVIATSVMAGVYTGTVAISGFFLGSLVDRYKKKSAMLLSSTSSLLLYAAASLIFISTPEEALADASNPTAKVWYELDRDLPDAVIDVASPRYGGILCIDGRGGRFLESPDLSKETLDPTRYLMVYAQSASGELTGRPASQVQLGGLGRHQGVPGGPPTPGVPTMPGGGGPSGAPEPTSTADLSGRTVVSQWRHPTSPGLLLLLSPVGA